MRFILSKCNLSLSPMLDRSSVETPGARARTKSTFVSPQQIWDMVEEANTSLQSVARLRKKEQSAGASLNICLLLVAEGFGPLLYAKQACLPAAAALTKVYDFYLLLVIRRCVLLTATYSVSCCK